MTGPVRAVLAIDQGTTNTKAVLVNEEGVCIAKASEPAHVFFPRPGWVEQDPIEIWQATRRAIQRCLSMCSGVSVVAIGISNQRESTVMWDRRTGQPLGPVISWQCGRSAAFCSELKRRGLEPEIRQRSGLPLEPMFSASKMRWLLDNVAGAFERAEAGEVCLGTIDSWLLWNLTGGKSWCTDVTNASRTQLLNLRQLEWDSSLLDAFGIPRASLPEVRPSCAIYGETAPTEEVPGGILVGSLIGDSHAALYGHGVPGPGWVKATYGTGSSLMCATADLKLDCQGLVATVAWADTATVYGLEGNILATGATVEWVQKLLGLDRPEDVSELARQVEDAGGVYLVPAFAGLGAPWWNEAARGLIAGITRGTGRAHVARAAFEAVAFQIRDVFDRMVSATGAPPQALLADGGASRDDFLMQLQADILGFPVMRNNSGDVSAMGAAYLAGLAAGLWRSPEEIRALPRSFSRFEPQMPGSWAQEKLAAWHAAVSRALLDVQGAKA